MRTVARTDPRGTPSARLGLDEHVVPEPRLAVRLRASGGRGTGRCRARAARARSGTGTARRRTALRRHRLAVDEQVPLGQVPAARPHEELRRTARRAGRPCPPGESNASVPRTASCSAAWPPTTFAHVGDSESSKSAMKHARARVERVDDHLRLGRAGDLDAPVAQVRRRLRATRHDGSARRRPSPAGARAWRRRRSRPGARPGARGARCGPGRTSDGGGATNSRASGVRTSLGARDPRADDRGRRDGSWSPRSPGRHVARSAGGTRRTVASIRPCGSVVDDEDLAGVVEAERRQVDLPVVQVREHHPDPVDRWLGVHHRPGHDPDRRLDRRAEVRPPGSFGGRPAHRPRRPRSRTPGSRQVAIRSPRSRGPSSPSAGRRPRAASCTDRGRSRRTPTSSSSSPSGRRRPASTSIAPDGSAATRASRVHVAGADERVRGRAGIASRPATSRAPRCRRWRARRPGALRSGARARGAKASGRAGQPVAGERVDRVLHRVGRDDVLVVAAGVGGVEVALERDRDRQVAEVVLLRVRGGP